MTDSMHHDHDLDLISSLAEGSPVDPVAAEELISSCPECASIYRSHVTVLEAIREESRPSLSELESRRLRTAVWSELAEGRDEQTRRAKRWTALASVAAALVLVVGTMTVLDRATSGDSAGGEATELATADATVPIALAAPTTVAADADAPEAFDSAAAGASEAADTLAAADVEGEESGPIDDTAEIEAFRQRFLLGESTIAPEFDCVDDVAGKIVAAEPAVLAIGDVWLVLVEEDQTDVQIFDQRDCSPLEVNE